MNEPHFFNISSRLDIIWILALEFSQLTSVYVMMKTFASRHLMALDTLSLVLVCWTIPNAGLGYGYENLVEWEDEKPSTQARCPSRDITWRKYLILSFTWVNGRRGINHTASTVSLIRTISEMSLMWRDKYRPYSDKLDLNVDWESSFESCALFPVSSVVYILYVKGICWWLHTGKRSTCGIR